MVNTVHAAQAQAAAAKKRKDEEAQRSASNSTSGRVHSGFSGLEAEVTPTRVSVNVEKKPERGNYQLKVERNFGTLDDGTEVFVKDITFPDNIHPDDEEKESQRILDQIRIGEKLDHPNHMTLLAYDPTGENEHRLIYTKAPGQRLEDVINERGLKTEEVLNITEQVASALSYLHDEFTPSIKHGDLAPKNILYDSETGLVTLVDHGSAVDTVCDDSSHTTRAMTPGFAGPEVGIGRIFTQSDVFGLGALMIYMITKKDPSQLFDCSKIELDYDQIRDLVEQATTNKNLISLIEDMTNLNYKARPSASEVVARVRRLKGLEEEVEEETTTYDSGVEGSKVEKREDDDWFIPGWNVPYESTSNIILGFLRIKNKSYESKLEILKGYHGKMSHLERDSQLLDLAIKLYSDRTNPESDIEAAVKEFDINNPEKIFGYSREEITTIGVFYSKGRLENTAPFNEEYLREYCQNPNFKKLIELSSEAGLSAGEVANIFDNIKKYDRRNFNGIDEERYEHYLGLLKFIEKEKKRSQREEKQNPYARPQIDPNLENRANCLESILRNQTEGKYKRDIRKTAILLSLEDEGLDMYQLINWTEPMEEDHHKTDFVFPRSKKREIKNTEVNGWEARKLALGVFSIVPYLFLTNLLGASDLTQAAIVAGGSIATGALLPEAIDYVRRKLTWNEFHGEVTRYYSSEKVLEAVVKTMERIPISERKHLAGKLKEIGEANDKMLSPYEMLEVAKGKIYDSLNTEIIYNSADFTKDEDIEKFIVSCLDTLGGQWVSNKDYFSATRYLISKKLISPEIGIEFICKRSEIDLEQYAEKEGYESVESMISDYKQPYNEYSHTASSSYKAIEIIEQMLKRRTQKTINVTIDSLKPGEDYNSPSEYLQKLIELEEDRVQKKSKPQTAMPSSQTPIKFRRVRGPKNNLFVYKDNRFGY